MTPYLAAVSADIDALNALQPGVATGLIQKGGAAAIALDGVPLRADEILSGLLAVVILSERGRIEARIFLGAMLDRFGAPPPVVIDLVDETDPALRALALQRALVAGLLRGRDGQAQRNTALMQDLAQMRVTYGRVQEAFARLEDHVHRNALADRQQILSLEPPEGAEPLRLVAGQTLEQRLPRDSQGLCDVALLLAEPAPVGDPEAGTGAGTGACLRVRLSTLEDDEIQAVWEIPAARLQPGWMRLSLQTALPPEARTALLRLEWTGPEALALAQAMRHPDPRFQARMVPGPEAGAESGDRVLALRLWNFVPGCAAPAPSDGMFPGGRPVRRLMIPGDTLAGSVNLRPANQPFLYLADSRSLLLHVSPAGPSVGVLAGGVPAQTSRLSAKIMTRAAGGPPVEYAFALAPAGEAAPQPGAELPDFAPGHITEWQRLPPMTEGELHLALPASLERAHDLYMITRLPEGIEDASWGWATFAAFRLIL